MESSYRPRILILSASDGDALGVAEELQRQLDYAYQPTLWTQGVFRAGRSAYESFASAVNNNAYGIFVLTPDDKLYSRDKEIEVPRMNVVFELGFFAAKHGIHRAFLLSPRGMPTNYLSDLAGIQPIDFNLERFRNGEREAALGAAVAAIKSAIRADNLIYPHKSFGRENLLSGNGGKIIAGVSYCLAAELGSGHDLRLRVSGSNPDASVDLSFGWIMSLSPSQIDWEHSIGIVNRSQLFWVSGPSKAFTTFTINPVCTELKIEVFENAAASDIDNNQPSKILKFSVYK